MKMDREKQIREEALRNMCLGGKTMPPYDTYLYLIDCIDKEREENSKKNERIAELEEALRDIRGLSHVKLDTTEKNHELVSLINSKAAKALEGR